MRGQKKLYSARDCLNPSVSLTQVRSGKLGLAWTLQWQTDRILLGLLQVRAVRVVP